MQLGMLAQRLGDSKLGYLNDVSLTATTWMLCCVRNLMWSRRWRRVGYLVNARKNNPIPNFLAMFVPFTVTCRFNIASYEAPSSGLDRVRDLIPRFKFASEVDPSWCPLNTYGQFSASHRPGNSVISIWNLLFRSPSWGNLTSQPPGISGRYRRP